MFEPTYTQKDLIEACAQNQCPACWLAQRAMSSYMRAFFYEEVNDIDLRASIRASLGYCEQHTWALLNAGMGNALGISIIYHDVVSNILRAMPESQSAPVSGSMSGFLKRFGQAFTGRLQSFRTALAPQKRCPACEMREKSLKLSLNAFARGLTTPALLDAYQASPGMCLPHLRRLLDHVDSPEVLEFLLAFTRNRLTALDGELAEFIRKNDHRFSKETMGSERDAWKRVIALSAGEHF